MSYKENLQSNNSDLQTLINTIKNMSGGISLSQTTFSFANSNNLDNKSKINDNNIDLQGLLLMANNLQVLKLAIPVQSGNLTYNGSTLSPTWTGYNSSTMTISGTTSATNAGTYTATFTPIGNYEWSDGTTGAKNVTWTINKASSSITLSKTSIALNTSTTSSTFTITKTGDGTLSVSSSNTNVATATLSGNTVTVKSVNNTNGTATITVSASATTNYNAPTSKTCKVTATFSITPQYVKTITDTDLPHYNFASANAGENGMLLFAGGKDRSSSVFRNTVIGYTDQLVKISPSQLATGRQYLNGATSTNYAVFAGGETADDIYTSSVEAFNSSGSRATASSMSNARYDMTSVTFKEYAIFAAGRNASSEFDTVEAYGATLTKKTASALPCQYVGAFVWTIGGAVTGDNMIFIGGTDVDQTYFNTDVAIYNSTLTLTKGTSLSAGIGRPVGLSVGNYACFIGGFDASYNYLNTVQVYNNSGVKSTTLTMPRNVVWPATTTLGRYGFIFAGEDDDDTSYNTVYTIDSNLVITTRTPMTEYRHWDDVNAGSVGNYALCTGGADSGNLTIDVYTAA